MTFPTLTAVTPGTGPTGGLTLCRLDGSGFRLPTVPAPSGRPTPAAPPTVRVTFGSLASPLVLVCADGVLFARAPIPAYPPPSAPLAVTVQNLADDGTPITGEAATLAGAFAYKMPDLSTAAETGMSYLVRMLMDEWAKQVIPNIVNTVHTDWDDDVEDGLNTIAVARFPAIVLGGPTFRLNRFYSVNQARVRPGGAAWVSLRPPYTVDLVFGVLGVSDHTGELLSLMSEAQRFLNRNNFLVVPSVANDPTSPSVRYEMDVEPGGDLRVISQPGESNVRAFSGSFLLRGFDLDDNDMAQLTGSVVGDQGASLSSERI